MPAKSSPTTRFLSRKKVASKRTRVNTLSRRNYFNEQVQKDNKN